LVALNETHWKGGIDMKARIMRLVGVLGGLAILVAVLGAGQKWS
jgi:hypothetical protein